MHSFAGKLGLDEVAFARDLASCEPLVKAQQADLAKLGVRATPSFFINGRFLSGAQPLEKFAALIDEELAKARKRVKKQAQRARYYDKWVLGKGLTSIAPVADTP